MPVGCLQWVDELQPWNCNTPTEIVRAAGGLVVRRQSGQLQIAVVHRPVHQDWSYPKGKLEEGETFEDAAQREVLEETGLVCRLLRFVGHTDYIDRKGRPKVVAYWVMSAVAGTFAAQRGGRRAPVGRRGRRPASCSPTSVTGSSWPSWRPMTSSSP